jgi:hypothetical protein
MIPEINFSPVSTIIAGDNDTGDKFIGGDNNSGEQLSPVTTTPVLNLLPVTRTGGHGGGELPRIGEVEGDKSLISPAAEVRHGRQWCQWNCHEKLHPKAPHTS